MAVMTFLRCAPWPVVVCSILLAGCGSTADDVRPAPPQQAPMVQRQRPAQPQGGDVRTQQAQILAKIRSDDPQKRTIMLAKFNERGDLGIVLNRDVSLERIRPMAKNLLTRLGRAFPNQNATVKIYAPNGAEIATATLDGSSGKMFYQPQKN